MVFKPRDTDLFFTEAEGGLVAGHVHWSPRERVVAWWNPGDRERRYEVARVLRAVPPTVFAFVDRLGRRFTLRKLTPTIYNAEIRRPGQRRLNTVAKLRAAYQRSLR